MVGASVWDADLGARYPGGTGGRIGALSVGPDHDRCHPWLVTSGGRAWGRLAAGWYQADGLHCLASLRQAEDRQVAMNAAQDRYRLPQMKASDADRDAVVAALSEHFQTGRAELTGLGFRGLEGGRECLDLGLARRATPYGREDLPLRTTGERLRHDVMTVAGT